MPLERRNELASMYAGNADMFKGRILSAMNAVGPPAGPIYATPTPTCPTHALCSKVLGDLRQMAACGSRAAKRGRRGEMGSTTLGGGNQVREESAIGCQEVLNW